MLWESGKGHITELGDSHTVGRYQCSRKTCIWKVVGSWSTIMQSVYKYSQAMCSWKILIQLEDGNATGRYVADYAE